MHPILRVAVLFAVCMSQFANTSAKNVPTEHEVLGHYYLQGATDVGSELVLSKTGKFQWILMYGNADYSAKGTWQQNGSDVVLSTGVPETASFRLFDDSETSFRKSPKEGTWVAVVGVPGVGPVADVEMRFETASGISATAISGRNGDAIVAMPASEQWARSGLRRAGSSDEFQWLNLPAERAQARIAGFAIVNPQSIQAVPFKTLKLRQEKGGLVVDDKAIGVRGVYVKQAR